jgi:hypothetical protein
VDQTGHDFPVAEAEPAREQLEFGEETPERRAHERILLVLLYRQEVEASDFAVGSDGNLEL